MEARLLEFGAESSTPWKAGTMARRRYQEGSIRDRGNAWEIRWKEDEEQDGKIIRHHRSKSIPKAEFPTKSLAKRERDRILKESGVKDETYCPSRLGNFEEFAAKYQKDVVPTMSPTTQSSLKSEFKAWKAALRFQRGGESLSMPMKEINAGVVQTIITQWHTGNGLKKADPKTIKNRVGSLRSAWQHALDWRFTRAEFPAHLRLPYWDKEEAKAKRPAYEMDVAKELIAESEFPYNLIWWLAFELHVRRGEVCGLDVGHINLVARQVTVRRNRVASVVKCTKARRPRVFTISVELCEALRPLIESRSAAEPLFLSPKGKRLHPENLVKRKLNPLLEKLGIKVKGTALHGLRHGAATELDRMNAPMATRLNRLGHSEEPMTLHYTHAVGEEDAKVASAFGKELSKAFTQSFTQQVVDDNEDEMMLLGCA
jgi:integrase